MYNPAMYQQGNVQPTDAMYQHHMMPSGSNFATDMHVSMSIPQSVASSAYQSHDGSSHMADASIDNSNHDDDADGGGKRRRVQRACDTCRKKKVRCDGLQPDTGACSNCANYGYKCTFVDAARKRAPPRSYVEAIEARIVKMEHLIVTLAPGVDFSDRIGKPIRRPDDKGDETNPDSNSAPTASPPSRLDVVHLDGQNNICGSTASISQMLSPSHMKARANSGSEQIQTSDEESEDDIAFLESKFDDVKIQSGNIADEGSTTFDSINAERIIVGEGSKANVRSRPGQVHKFIGKASAMHSLPFLEKLSSKSQSELGIHPKGARQEFWDVPNGLLDPPPDPSIASSAWPAPALAEKLIDTYFGRPNREYPIINEAEFRHQYSKCPELRRDTEWLACTFSIFMVASQYLDDEGVRAFPDDPHSRGMHWWQAAKALLFNNARLQKPLFAVQSFLLAAIFQFSIPLSASASWLLLGVAIRWLLDMGAHRKNAAKKLGLSRLEEETCKRIFWVAYSLDREMAAALGRPIMLQDEDIDVELPLEIDDQYLFATAQGETPAEQPSNKPALISGFLCSLRLDEITGRTLKTVYALQKTKARFGIVSKDWDERLVTEIDSALNNWLDTVPPHLRYDPHEPNDEWLMQSSLLYSKYYNCQILVHRPFIPARKGNNTSILNFPSLAICTNAARSISHLIQSLKDRNLHIYIGIPVAFRSVSASTILLMVVWGAKRNGGRVSSSASADLRRSIDVLRSMESHWQFCGKAVDILESIMTSTHVSVPRHSEQGIKRTRDGSEVQDVQIDEDSSATQSSEADAAADTKAKGSVGKAKRKVKASTAHAGREDGQPLAPEARQLPLSTQQLATIDSSSSVDQSPALATDTKWSEGSVNQGLFGDVLGPTTPQPGSRARMQSVNAPPGISSALSFGLFSPSSTQWATGNEPDYLHGPHSQAANFQSVPTIIPSIFDNLGLPGTSEDALAATVGDLPDMSQFGFGPAVTSNGDVYGGFDRFYSEAQAGQIKGEGLHGENATTPQSDESTNLANYAFDLLQKQSVWNLDTESLSILQRRAQQG